MSPRVMLLGASGFIGSHVLAALTARGVRVIALCRRAPTPRPALETVDPALVQWRVGGLQLAVQASDWLPVISEVDVVINCVGILRQRRGQRYDDVHHRLPSALATACAQCGVRLIHTSALGLHENARSRFLSSKLLGERAVASSGADHCIVRPSLIDGRGGFGASWLRMLALSPVQLVPRGARGRIAAVQATDLGEAYAALALMPTLAGWRQAELGGPEHYSYGAYLQLLRGAGLASTGRSRAWQLPLPDWMTRVGAHLCDLFRFSPFSYGHWILLQRDNVPAVNAMPLLLGRPPRPVGHVLDHQAGDMRLS